MKKEQVNNIHSTHEAPRPRRKKHHAPMHEGEGEGWAVSYSDLLMVLMSFFIIFYNTDDTTGERIDSLIKDLDLSGITVNKEKIQTNENREIASVKPTGIKATEIAPEKVAESRWEDVLNKGKEASKYKGGLIIDLSNNIFKNGQYEIRSSAEEELKALLKVIKPHQKNLNVVFIGHTDSVPVVSKKNVIDSNLILSHLRAAKAVELAINEGFDPMWVSSQGLSKFTRNTRSLSIRIMER